VVGFIDYQCPSCRAHFGDVERRVAQMPNASLYVLQMPLPSHPIAAPAATVALEAAERGEFPQVHKALLAGKELTWASLNGVAKRFGLSVRGDAGIRQELAAEKKAFLDLKLSFVPVFVISDSGSTQAYGWREALGRLK